MPQVDYLEAFSSLLTLLIHASTRVFVEQHEQALEGNFVQP